MNQIPPQILSFINNQVMTLRREIASQLGKISTDQRTIAELVKTDKTHSGLIMYLMKRIKKLDCIEAWLKVLEEKIDEGGEEVKEEIEKIWNTINEFYNSENKEIIANIRNEFITTNEFHTTNNNTIINDYGITTNVIHAETIYGDTINGDEFHTTNNNTIINDDGITTNIITADEFHTTNNNTVITDEGITTNNITIGGENGIQLTEGTIHIDGHDDINVLQTNGDNGLASNSLTLVNGDQTVTFFINEQGDVEVLDEQGKPVTITNLIQASGLISPVKVYTGVDPEGHPVEDTKVSNVIVSKTNTTEADRPTILAPNKYVWDFDSAGSMPTEIKTSELTMKGTDGSSTITAIGINHKGDEKPYLATDGYVDDKVNEITGDINILEERVTNIEGDINNIKGDITTIEGDLSELTTKVENHETKINNIEGDINNIEGDLTELTTKVENHETKINNIEGDLTELTTKVENHETRITNIENNMPTIVNKEDLDAHSDTSNVYNTYYINNVVDNLGNQITILGDEITDIKQELTDEFVKYEDIKDSKQPDGQTKDTYTTNYVNQLESSINGRIDKYLEKSHVVDEYESNPQTYDVYSASALNSQVKTADLTLPQKDSTSTDIHATSIKIGEDDDTSGVALVTENAVNDMIENNTHENITTNNVQIPFSLKDEDVQNYSIQMIKDNASEEGGNNAQVIIKDSYNLTNSTTTNTIEGSTEKMDQLQYIKNITVNNIAVKLSVQQNLYKGIYIDKRHGGDYDGDLKEPRICAERSIIAEFNWTGSTPALNSFLNNLEKQLYINYYDDGDNEVGVPRRFEVDGFAIGLYGAMRRETLENTNNHYKIRFSPSYTCARLNTGDKIFNTETNQYEVIRPELYLSAPEINSYESSYSYTNDKNSTHYYSQSGASSSTINYLSHQSGNHIIQGQDPKTGTLAKIYTKVPIASANYRAVNELETYADTRVRVGTEDYSSIDVEIVYTNFGMEELKFDSYTHNVHTDVKLRFTIPDENDVKAKRVVANTVRGINSGTFKIPLPFIYELTNKYGNISFAQADPLYEYNVEHESGSGSAHTYTCALDIIVTGINLNDETDENGAPTVKIYGKGEHKTVINSHNIDVESLTLPDKDDNTEKVIATSIKMSENDDRNSVALITEAKVDDKIEEAIGDIDLSTCVKYVDIKDEKEDPGTTNTVYSTNYINNLMNEITPESINIPYSRLNSDNKQGYSIIAEQDNAQEDPEALAKITLKDGYNDDTNNLSTVINGQYSHISNNQIEWKKGVIMDDDIIGEKLDLEYNADDATQKDYSVSFNKHMRIEGHIYGSFDFEGETYEFTDYSCEKYLEESGMGSDISKYASITCKIVTGGQLPSDKLERLTQKIRAVLSRNEYSGSSYMNEMNQSYICKRTKPNLSWNPSINGYDITLTNDTNILELETGAYEYDDENGASYSEPKIRFHGDKDGQEQIIVHPNKVSMTDTEEKHTHEITAEKNHLTTNAMESYDRIMTADDVYEDEDHAWISKTIVVGSSTISGYRVNNPPEGFGNEVYYAEMIGKFVRDPIDNVSSLYRQCYVLKRIGEGNEQYGNFYIVPQAEITIDAQEASLDRKRTDTLEIHSNRIDFFSNKDDDYLWSGHGHTISMRGGGITHNSTSNEWEYESSYIFTTADDNEFGYNLESAMTPIGFGAFFGAGSGPILTDPDYQMTFDIGSRMTNTNIFSRSLTLPKVGEAISESTTQITATSITPKEDEDWTSVSLITAAQTQKLIDDAISGGIDLTNYIKFVDASAGVNGGVPFSEKDGNVQNYSIQLIKDNAHDENGKDARILIKNSYNEGNTNTNTEIDGKAMTQTYEQGTVVMGRVLERADDDPDDPGFYKIGRKINMELNSSENIHVADQKIITTHVPDIEIEIDGDTYTAEDIYVDLTENVEPTTSLYYGQYSLVHGIIRTSAKLSTEMENKIANALKVQIYVNGYNRDHVITKNEISVGRRENVQLTWMTSKGYYYFHTDNSQPDITLKKSGYVHDEEDADIYRYDEQTLTMKLMDNENTNYNQFEAAPSHVTMSNGTSTRETDTKTKNISTANKNHIIGSNSEIMMKKYDSDDYEWDLEDDGVNNLLKAVVTHANQWTDQSGELTNLPDGFSDRLFNGSMVTIFRDDGSNSGICMRDGIMSEYGTQNLEADPKFGKYYFLEPSRNNCHDASGNYNGRETLLNAGSYHIDLIEDRSDHEAYSTDRFGLQIMGPSPGRYIPPYIRIDGSAKKSEASNLWRSTVSPGVIGVWYAEKVKASQQYLLPTSNYLFTYGSRITKDNMASRSLTLPKVDFGTITDLTEKITATSITPHSSDNPDSVSLITKAYADNTYLSSIDDIVNNSVTTNAFYVPYLDTSGKVIEAHQDTTTDVAYILVKGEHNDATHTSELTLSADNATFASSLPESNTNSTTVNERKLSIKIKNDSYDNETGTYTEPEIEMMNTSNEINTISITPSTSIVASDTNKFIVRANQELLTNNEFEEVNTLDPNMEDTFPVFAYNVKYSENGLKNESLNVMDFEEFHYSSAELDLDGKLVKDINNTLTLSSLPDVLLNFTSKAYDYNPDQWKVFVGRILNEGTMSGTPAVWSSVNQRMAALSGKTEITPNSIEIYPGIKEYKYNTEDEDVHKVVDGYDVVHISATPVTISDTPSIVIKPVQTRPSESGYGISINEPEFRIRRNVGSETGEYSLLMQPTNITMNGHYTTDESNPIKTVVITNDTTAGDGKDVPATITINETVQEQPSIGQNRTIQIDPTIIKFTPSVKKNGNYNTQSIEINNDEYSEDHSLAAQFILNRTFKPASIQIHTTSPYADTLSRDATLITGSSTVTPILRVGDSTSMAANNTEANAVVGSDIYKLVQYPPSGTYGRVGLAGTSYVLDTVSNLLSVESCGEWGTQIILDAASTHVMIEGMDTHTWDFNNQIIDRTKNYNNAQIILDSGTVSNYGFPISSTGGLISTNHELIIKNGKFGACTGKYGSNKNRGMWFFWPETSMANFSALLFKKITFKNCKCTYSSNLVFGNMSGIEVDINGLDMSKCELITPITERKGVGADMMPKIINTNPTFINVNPVVFDCFDEFEEPDYSLCNFKYNNVDWYISTPITFERIGNLQEVKIGNNTAISPRIIFRDSTGDRDKQSFDCGLGGSLEVLNLQNLIIKNSTIMNSKGIVKNFPRHTMLPSYMQGYLRLVEYDSTNHYYELRYYSVPNDFNQYPRSVGNYKVIMRETDTSGKIKTNNLTADTADDGTPYYTGFGVRKFEGSDCIMITSDHETENVGIDFDVVDISANVQNIGSTVQHIAASSRIIRAGEDFEAHLCTIQDGFNLTTTNYTITRMTVQVLKHDGSTESVSGSYSTVNDKFVITIPQQTFSGYYKVHLTIDLVNTV